MAHQSDLIGEDINEYLKQHEQKQLLRLLTCGSVDDGKSTLIGRLLHDSKMIFEIISRSFCDNNCILPLYHIPKNIVSKSFSKKKYPKELIVT